MTTAGLGIVAVAGMAVAGRSRLAHRPISLAVPVGLVWFPVPTVLASLLYVTGRRLAAMRATRRSSLESAAQLVIVAEMTALGLAAGRNVPQALGTAGDAVGEPLRSEVSGVLRKARLVGLSPALAADESRCAPLSRRIATAVETGAPVRGALESLVEERLAIERNEGLIRARRLPVKLLFPLALLILPGFLALTIGPALLTSIDRLA